MSPSVHLVAGLESPGPAYVPIRHNTGLWVIDGLVSRLEVRLGITHGQWTEVATERLPGEHRLVLVKPTIYMNDPGIVVAAIARLHKTLPADAAAIRDELDLEPTHLRLKLGDGDNSHSGLESIHAHLSIGDLHRARVGIGRPPGRQSAADYVLSWMRLADLDVIRFDAMVAADAAETLVTEGFVVIQSRFNN